MRNPLLIRGEGKAEEETAAKGKVEKEIWEEVKLNYSGYKFTRYAAPVYNPFALLYYFKSGCPLDTWGMDDERELVKRIFARYPDLYYDPEHIVVASTSSTKDSEDSKRDAIKRLLHLGYFTILREDYGVKYVGVPNRLIRNNLANIFRSTPEMEKSIHLQEELSRYMEVAQFQEVGETLNELLSLMPYPGQSESHFHGFFRAWLGERVDVEDLGGKSDIIYVGKSITTVIELKLISNPEDAFDQIIRKHYCSTPGLRKPNPVYALGMTINSDSKQVEKIAYALVYDHFKQCEIKRVDVEIKQAEKLPAISGKKPPVSPGKKTPVSTGTNAPREIIQPNSFQSEFWHFVIVFTSNL